MHLNFTLSSKLLTANSKGCSNSSLANGLWFISLTKQSAMKSVSCGENLSGCDSVGGGFLGI